jgi:hypothetical protein
LEIGFWRAAAEFDAFQAKCTARLNAMEKAAERALEDAIEHAIENAAGIKREPDPRHTAAVNGTIETISER